MNCVNPSRVVYIPIAPLFHITMMGWATNARGSSLGYLWGGFSYGLGRFLFAMSWLQQ